MSILQEKEREFEESKDRAVEAARREAEMQLDKTLQQFEERFADAESDKRRAVEEAQRAEEKRYKAQLSEKLQHEESLREEAEEYVRKEMERHEAAKVKRAVKQAEEEMREEFHRVVAGVRDDEARRFQQMLAAKLEDMTGDKHDAMQQVREEEQAARAKWEAEFTRKHEEKVARMQEEQQNIRKHVIREVEQESAAKFRQKIEDVRLEHEHEISEIMRKHHQDKQAWELSMSKDILRFRREAERDVEESKQKIREAEDEMLEAEEYAARNQQTVARLLSDRRTHRLATYWISFVREWVLSKKRAERFGERTIHDNNQMIMNQVFRAFELNLRRAQNDKQLEIAEEGLFHTQKVVVSLWEDRSHENLLRNCFEVFYQKWAADQSGLRQFKKQKQSTLEVVEHMQNMTKAAELKAEKVQMNQEEMLHRVVSFVKKNRADQQRRTVS